MDKEKATQFVIQELGKHHNRDQIIFALCETMGFNWSDAEQLIREIEAEHGREITARQSPIILLLGVAIFIAGLWLVISSSLYFISFIQSQSNGVTLEAAFEVRTLYLRGGSFLAGIGMMIGALIGCWQIITELLNG